MLDFIFEWPGRHETVDSLFLMGSPFPIAVIIACYLYFVLNYGPKLMETRKPMKVRKVIIPYNIFQIIACVSIISGVKVYFEF
jgi:GNS1/SUR4 family